MAARDAREAFGLIDGWITLGDPSEVAWIVADLACHASTTAGGGTRGKPGRVWSASAALRLIQS